MKCGDSAQNLGDAKNTFGDSLVLGNQGIMLRFSLCVHVNASPYGSNYQFDAFDSWCLHESEIQVQGNQRFFFLAASQLIFSTSREEEKSRKTSGTRAFYRELCQQESPKDGCHVLLTIFYWRDSKMTCKY